MPKPLLILVGLVLAALLATVALSTPQDAPQDAPATQDETPAEPAAPTTIDGRPTHLEGWQDVSCASCHEAIAEEWATTLHAQAWVDERYQEAVKYKRRPASCYGCHIPEPIHEGEVGRKLRPRADDEENPHHFGVSCKTCHLGPDGAMLGPYESSPENELSGAHASRQSESFLEGSARDALCINCHRTNVGPVIGIAKDFEQTRQADTGRSCVGCHMPEVTRSMAVVTNDDGTVYTAPERAGRAHTLRTPRDPEFLAQAFLLTPTRTQGGATLAIANDAGHRVPGLKSRSMTFVATALDAAGTELGTAELTIDSDAPLLVDTPQYLLVETGGERAASLAVRGTHAWEGPPEPVVFLDLVLDLDPPTDGTR
ncbi:MAG: multiheme c-type cytochrome [Planctomycetota bacterium]|nr:multiheme c-type cytochrome [Planctomycetota bacterium]